MDMRFGQEDIAGMLSLRQITNSPIPGETGTRPTKCGTRITPHRAAEDWTTMPAPTVIEPVRQARVPDYIEQWPMQKIATDMVEFAEELHQGLMPAAGMGHASAPERFRLTLMRLDARLETLLARSGIERADPTGSMFNPLIHYRMAEECVASEIPGTIVRALSSTWTLNGQLLRPAMVIVSAASLEDIVTGATLPVSPVSLESEF